MATGTPDGVDLVDKDNAGSLFLGILKEVTHARGADTHEHLDEVGARHGEEWHVGLACHGFGQKGLASARRTHEEHSLGDLAAEVGVALGVLEEVDHLHDLLLGARQTGDILEGGVGGSLAVVHLGFALAYTEDAATAAHLALRDAAHDDEEEDEE